MSAKKGPETSIQKRRALSWNNAADNKIRAGKIGSEGRLGEHPPPREILGGAITNLARTPRYHRRHCLVVSNSVRANHTQLSKKNLEENVWKLRDRCRNRWKKKKWKGNNITSCENSFSKFLIRSLDFRRVKKGPNEARINFSLRRVLNEARERECRTNIGNIGIKKNSLWGGKNSSFSRF